MGFLSDLFFGTGSSINPGNSKKGIFSDDFFSSKADDIYEDYYEELHSDATAGDIDAAEEMEDEFGEDWDGEY